MYNRIAKIGIEVKDLEKSLDFYVNTCGMKLLERFPRDDGKGDNVFLDGGSVIFELMPTRKPGGAHLHHIALAADDVDEAAEYFRGRGVNVTMEPIVVETNIHLADVADPDGMRVRLFKRDN